MTLPFPDTVERWSLDRLIPHARNARTHSEDQVAQITGSIAESASSIRCLSARTV
jgi:hypothetical protein